MAAGACVSRRSRVCTRRLLIEELQTMKLHQGDTRFAPLSRIPRLRAFFASILASALFLAPCLDAANGAYSAPPVKEKKQKQDPILKGLPRSLLFGKVSG